ncbi:MAG: hypothetical protein ACREDK_08450 [Thermoplasmata archaeon]
MPTLFVRCASCTTEFPTRLAVEDLHGSTLVVSGLPLRCPSCHAESMYYTKDLFVPMPPTETAPATVVARRRGPLPGPIP